MKLLIIFTALSLTSLNPTSAHPKTHQTCNSPECQLQSKSLLSKIDTSASPCDDFYQFACGNYKDIGSPMIDQATNIDRWILKLATDPLRKHDGKLVKLIKIFYMSCLNNRGSLSDFIEDGTSMRRKVGTDGDYENFEEAIQELQFSQNSDAYIFSMRMEFVDEQALLVVDQPKFETKAGFVDRKDEKVQEFNRNFINYLVEEGFDQEEVEDMQTNAFKFEDKLLELVDESSSEAKIEVIKISELQEVFNFINWTNFIENFFNGSEKIDETFILGVKNRAAMMKIDNFLFTRSDDDVLDYLIWRYIEALYISLFYKDDDEESAEKLSFDAVNPNCNRKAVCTSCICKLKKELDVAVAAVYAKHSLTQTDRQEVTDMIIAMKSQLQDTFKTLDWLDSKTRAAASKKLSKMKFFVGYPDLLVNEQFLSEYYRDLHVSKHSLVQNIDQIARLKNENQRKFLTSPKVNKEVLFTIMTAQYIITPNALYTYHFNYFLICAGLIHSNTFSTDRPQAMNFGATGYAIGHEIFHGFDNQGRLYDENGSARNWWEKGTEKKFLEKSKCFVDQYGSYVEPTTGMGINGAKNLGENIADNGGLMLAYNTFQKVQGFDTILPNANFTSNQLFWLSMAQFYCSNTSYEGMKHQIECDPHTPGRFRVFGTLGNLEQFSDDFQCPAGSKMNRMNKCKIW
ncbi:hypothetical protein ACKWTF_014446 [Chironomus riparius]